MANFIPLQMVQVWVAFQFNLLPPYSLRSQRNKFITVSGKPKEIDISEQDGMHSFILTSIKLIAESKPKRKDISPEIMTFKL